MCERRRLTIRGVVQGVFFRETVRRFASRYGVDGWVCNVGHDALVIEAEGEPHVVEAFIAHVLAHPPAGAHIEDVRSAPMPTQGDVGFSIAPSAR
jgi:hydrogenase maturation factor HypF (carbamoyltransferase family)